MAARKVWEVYVEVIQTYRVEVTGEWASDAMAAAEEKVRGGGGTKAGEPHVWVSSWAPVTEVDP